MAETSDNTTSPQQEAKKEKKAKKVWTLEKCLKAARRFLSQEEWARQAPSSFKSASSHRWLDQCCAHMHGNSNSSPTSQPRKKQKAHPPGKMSA